MSGSARRTRPTPKPKPPPRHGTKVDEHAIALREGKGSPEAGGGRGGYYWHIDVDGKRVGRVFINMIDETPFGEHPSIQIYLNKNQQGRRIGSVAYRLACEASGYDAVYAHMSKSNVASQRAAGAAGFEVVERPDLRQLTMVWHRR